MKRLCEVCLIAHAVSHVSGYHLRAMHYTVPQSDRHTYNNGPDFTASTIMERFADEQAAASVERCLKKLAANKAKAMLEAREPKLPSPTFISAYLGAFRPHDKPALPGTPSQGDQTLDLAFDALAAADYAHAVSLVHEAIDQGISTKEGEAEAYNMRGTFK